jgi:hypothetical protein
LSESHGVCHSTSHHQAVELYRTWGAFEKANHLEKKCNNEYCQVMSR